MVLYSMNHKLNGEFFLPTRSPGFLSDLLSQFVLQSIYTQDSGDQQAKCDLQVYSTFNIFHRSKK